MWEYRVTFTDGHVGRWHQHDKNVVLDVIAGRYKIVPEYSYEHIYTIEIRPVS